MRARAAAWDRAGGRFASRRRFCRYFRRAGTGRSSDWRRVLVSSPRFTGVSGRWVVQLVVLALVAGAGVAACGAGSAFAGGSYTCTGVAATDGPALQGLIDSGGTVTVSGRCPVVATGTW